MAKVARRQSRVIGYTLARVLVLLGLAMLPAAVLGAGRGEWDAVSALLIGAAGCVLAGSVGRMVLRSDTRLTWTPAFVAMAWSWLVGAVAGAVPLYLSGHYDSFGAAVFEALSGITTTGLTVVEDLDHLSLAMNAWRHTLQMVGATIVIVTVHALLARRGSELGTVNVPEHGDDRVLPNLRRTTRFALLVFGTWFVLGSASLWVAAVTTGHSAGRAALHAVSLSASALSTSGFAATSASVGLHHAVSVELLVGLLLLAGVVSLGLHEQLWRGPRRTVPLDLDARTFAVSVGVLTVIAFLGLTTSGALAGVGPLLRKGLFMVVSAHTTSGLTTEPARVIATDWGAIVPAVLVAAMTIGGLAGSTAGGVKGLRVGLIAKGIVAEVQRMLLPESALVVSTYHQRVRRRLTDAHVRASATILLLVLGAALGGAMLLLLVTQDVPLTDALFATTAAVTNTGLAIGVLTPQASGPVQLLLGLLMWLGRVEFLAAFALLGSLLLRPGRRT
jgi:trk system potassium uptake protein TrkH